MYYAVKTAHSFTAHNCGRVNKGMKVLNLGFVFPILGWVFFHSKHFKKINYKEFKNKLF